MNDYIIVPPGPFYKIIKASEGQTIALQIPDEKWAERIVTALTLLDAHEKDHKVESYIEGLRRKVGQGGE